MSNTLDLPDQVGGSGGKNPEGSTAISGGVMSGRDERITEPFLPRGARKGDPRAFAKG